MLSHAVTTGAVNGGSWVGTYGVDGYALGGWTGPATGDLVSLPQATLTLEQGARYNWDTAPSTDVRALQSPTGSTRQATGWYDATQLKLRLNFTQAYTGTLHVYGFDWENAGRRMKITVTDGTTTKIVPITTSFQQAVVHFPISVPAGGIVRVTADKSAANNAVIAGLFLGGAGTPPSRRPRRRRPTSPASRVWVGTYGVDGYALGGWNGPRHERPRGPAPGDADRGAGPALRLGWRDIAGRRAGAPEPRRDPPAGPTGLVTTPPSSSCG